jgi:neutral ceramidase
MFFQNNLRLEGTYLAVERLESSLWVMMRSDSHPSTVYQWQRDNTVRFLILCARADGL